MSKHVVKAEKPVVVKHRAYVVLSSLPTIHHQKASLFRRKRKKTEECAFRNEKGEKKSLKKSSPKQSVGLAPKKAKHSVNDQKKKTRERENNGKKKKLEKKRKNCFCFLSFHTAVSQDIWKERLVIAPVA